MGFPLFHIMPHLLSGANNGCAGVFAMQPLSRADEPTAMLDPRGRNEVLATVKN